MLWLFVVYFVVIWSFQRFGCVKWKNVIDRFVFREGQGCFFCWKFPRRLNDKLWRYFSKILEHSSWTVWLAINTSNLSSQLQTIFQISCHILTSKPFSKSSSAVHLFNRNFFSKTCELVLSAFNQVYCQYTRILFSSRWRQTWMLVKISTVSLWCETLGEVFTGPINKPEQCQRSYQLASNYNFLFQTFQWLLIHFEEIDFCPA